MSRIQEPVADYIFRKVKDFLEISRSVQYHRLIVYNGNLPVIIKSSIWPSITPYEAPSGPNDNSISGDPFLLVEHLIMELYGNVTIIQSADPFILGDHHQIWKEIYCIQSARYVGD